jgi:hypothetical protein
VVCRIVSGRWARRQSLGVGRRFCRGEASREVGDAFGAVEVGEGEREQRRELVVDFVVLAGGSTVWTGCALVVRR